jgi:anti-sigma B factor antagonist
MDVSRRLEISASAAGPGLLISGELDVATCVELDAALDDVDASTGIDIDMTGVTFIDSSALRVLVEHHARLEAGGGRLGLVNLSSASTRLLEISGLDGYLHVS